MQMQKILATKEIRFGMKNIIFIIGALLATSLCLNLFSVGKISEQNKIVLEKEKQLQALKDQLAIQKVKTSELQKQTDSLLLLWRATPKEIIMKQIVQKNNEKKHFISNATDDELLRIFADILQEKK